MTFITRRNLTIGAVAIVAIAALGYAGVQAQNTDSGPGQSMGRGRGGPGFGRFGGPGGRGGPLGELGIINRLNLTEDQRNQVRQLMESRQEETRALAEKLRSAHEGLQAAVTANSFDEGTIRARSADVASAEADMAVARGRLHADVLQILTAEQRTRLNQLQAQMKERRGERGRPRSGAVPR
jgi:protein CpxP